MSDCIESTLDDYVKEVIKFCKDKRHATKMKLWRADRERYLKKRSDEINLKGLGLLKEEVK